MKCLITSYQLIHPSGARDTIKLLVPVLLNDTDIEDYRNELRQRHSHAAVNLNYTELP